MIDHGMSLINDTLHISIPDASKVNKVIYNGVEFVSGTQWIPCSEMLPEVGQNVLISVGRGMTTTEACLRNDGDWHQFRWGTIWAAYYVDAWMPLPNPYKEEEDGCVHQ